MPDLEAWARLSGYPNPFNPRIEIAFELQDPQRISLEVFDVAGRRIKVLAEGGFAAATHQISWDGKDSLGHGVPGGCYFVLLRGEQAHTIPEGHACAVDPFICRNPWY